MHVLIGAIQSTYVSYSIFPISILPIRTQKPLFGLNFWFCRQFFVGFEICGLSAGLDWFACWKTLEIT
jgi:hypothetical protein